MRIRKCATKIRLLTTWVKAMQAQVLTSSKETIF